MYLDITGHSWESFWNGVRDWFSEHQTEIIIGTAFIVAGILTMGAAAAIGGATFAGVMTAMGSAALSSAIQVGITMGISATIGGTISAISGNGFWGGFGDGLASGYMWGGIFAGTAQLISGGFKIAATFGAKTGIKGGFKLMSNVKVLSPNNLGHYEAGGTLLKVGNIVSRYGKNVRFDVGARTFLHLNIQLAKNYHLYFAKYLAGIIGGLQS